jgi:predicted RND superfamily exporter protein
MSAGSQGILASLLRFVVARRWWVVSLYMLLIPPSIWFGLKVGQDNSLDRMIVQTDPDYANHKAFEKIFGSGQYVLLLAEAADPFTPEVLQRLDRVERALQSSPGVEVSSALSIFRRAKGGFEASPAQAEAFRRFAYGTTLFREQGLVGEGFLTIPIVLSAGSPEELKVKLGSVDRAIAGLEANLAPLTALRKVGLPYVNRYLDEETRRASLRYFPLFGLLVLGVNLALYRSFRTLAAFVLTLGVCVTLTVGYVGLTGGVITIVSPLVPMTILTTCTATLVYIHSRFVEHPAGRSIDERQIAALLNKFTACTASLFATAAGFLGLVVSKIPPIRDMGIWVAVGLSFTWVVVFTLFPALQRILRTPTLQERRIAGAWFQDLAERLPAFSYRWRWLLVPSSLLLCVAGAGAIFGLPGLLAPMGIATNGIEYLSHDSTLYRDTKRLEQVISGLAVTEVWLAGPVGSLTEPEVLRGINRFQEALRHEKTIGAVAGPTTVLRMMRYLEGSGDRFPEDPAVLAKMGADLEQILPSQPMLQRFIDPATLSQTHVAVISRTVDYEGFQQLDSLIRQRWKEAALAVPALAAFGVRIVGTAPLEAKISHQLVPTLVQSFGLTVLIIFGVFLLVFRNGPARMLAMIPSLLAILVMFAVMRVTGMALNVATILVASIVHFFYHFLERRRTGSAEESLLHALRIAGRAIFFATLINAGGFLAFVFADLPPMRQFGVLSALAFLLSMVADFTALLAALWMVFRERPDGHKRTGAVGKATIHDQETHRL